MSDWTNEPGWAEYRNHVLQEMLPKLLGSSVAVSVCPSDVGDVKYWVELGAMIMHDKPIIVVADPSREIPERLARVADSVIWADLSTEAGVQAVTEALIVQLETAQ